ncbi:hypothetical protein A2899_01025 [Candidatus Amesbacteria bacterium RIFCSPLOWO2_01_FULL_49_25]|uniref:4-alpha-glucanotransferase n=1 Tax=Candidatus Amesbacteria bacterium RIFCSPHIGHO2_01_FULL_48_32b TaxID=1797253 RepID=A0A1F4YFQ1_9BACT|nr:MAG: hypothetical protein A2876_00175 [Candidatus Amesbacteria bacterium RIFCSPHIGHO2_01_FULL_48_32b]OGD07146.1 MAG: hypothetical protein A2899_01025 [Candidatus Amesbacteria bacterium RIFCSPLOWO2_01_FULL_49_25]
MPTRVLMIGWELPPHNSGGLGVASLGLAKALSSRLSLTFLLPHHLDVVSTPFPVLFSNLSEINLLITPYSTRTFTQTDNTFFSDLLSQVYKYAAAAKKIASKLQFDLIHVHDWLTIPAGLAVKNVCNKPLVIHVHATEFDRSGGLGANPVVYAIEKAGFDAADAVIAISNYVKGMLVTRYSVDPKKIFVVHNGIDAADYSSTSGPIAFLQTAKSAGHKIVLYVGRITIQKGIDHLLNAAQKVITHFPKVFFVIAGSGDMEGQVISQAASMGISQHFLFPGFVRGPQLNDLFRSADLFVLPSVSEPFGLVPLEAIVNGTPALISKQSGVSEVLSHALKVDFWDTEEMANQILAVLNYSSLPQTLIAESSREVDRLTWVAAADKVINLYNQL